MLDFAASHCHSCRQISINTAMLNSCHKAGIAWSEMSYSQIEKSVSGVFKFRFRHLNFKMVNLVHSKSSLLSS